MSKLKIFCIALMALVIFLQYRLWFESGGILDMMHLKKQLALETKQNEQLKKRNNALRDQVQHLQKNKNAVESRARHELGMIKEGEVFYQVVE